MRDKFLLFAPPSIGEAEIDAVVDVLKSGWITTGPKSRELEQAFVDDLGIEAALAVNSATAALHLGLAVEGVGPGDAVFTTTMTFCSTVHVIEHLGATPVLVDVDPDTLNLSPDTLRNAIEKVRTNGEFTPRAVIPVHYGGHPCDMEQLFDICREYDLFLLEDAAHAMPSFYGEKKVGSPLPSDVTGMAAFSFYATKNITTAEGGMLTGSAEQIDRARVLSLHGMSKDAWRRYEKGGTWRYDVMSPGFKYNLSDIHAAIGVAQLSKLHSFAARRRVIAETYQREFTAVSEIATPIERPGMTSSWHLFPIRLDLEQLTISRDEFIVALGERNIGTSVHFIPVHSMSYYRERYGLTDADFPAAAQAFNEMISIPIYPDMSDDDVFDVIQAVIDVAKSSAR